MMIIDAELGNSFARNLPPEHEISVRTEKCLGSQFRGNFGFGNRNEKLPRTWPWMSWPRTQGRSRCCCCCVAADISIGAFLTNGLSLFLSLSRSHKQSPFSAVSWQTYAHTHIRMHTRTLTHKRTRGIVVDHCYLPSLFRVIRETFLLQKFQQLASNISIFISVERMRQKHIFIRTLV